MKLIRREDYLNHLFDLKGTPDIKVLTGIRRSGKSKLLDAFSEEISKTEKDANIVLINLRLKKFESLLDGNNLYAYVNSKLVDGKNNYVFIDEIQDASDFERVVTSLLDEERCDLYLTGSNAFLLSSDLATLFGGRTIPLHVFPFSFREFRKYFDYRDIDQAFDEYVFNGGMSGSYPYVQRNDSLSYLKSVVQATIVKDIVRKYRIENESLLNLIIDFLMDNIGSRVSIRKIANKLSSSSYRTNDKTVGTYLDYLTKSFLFYPVQRYDIKGKRYLESIKKYYLCDLGFRFALLGNWNADYGHLYENLVAIELMRRGYEVGIGTLYDKEIDFIATKGEKKIYIQVSDDITREETFKREVSSLLQIRDAYPKILIARTKHEKQSFQGIEILDIARFLDS